MLIDTSTSSRTIDSTSRPTYPTSVNFEASTLMNGAPASRASRRAISVFPTPVGPIMMMLLGRISSRMSSGAWARRQRLRTAIATAFFAASCPTMYRSSSETILRGGSSSSHGIGSTASGVVGGGGGGSLRRGLVGSAIVQLEDGDVGVGVHADLGGDLQRALHDLLGRELRVAEQRPRRGERVAAARADRQHPVVGLDQLAGAADHVAALLVGHREQCLEAAQHPVRAPVLGELHGRPRQVAGVALQLLLELLEQREGVGRRARKAGEDLAALQGPDLGRIRLHDRVAHRDLTVATHSDGAVPADGEDGRAVYALKLGHFASMPQAATLSDVLG